MADVMEFPKTIQEFIEGYSFKDSDEVYTNGVELIPVFRVEQALEHYLPEVRAKARAETIDEFVKTLDEKTEEMFEPDGGGLRDMSHYNNALCDVHEIVKEIAQQLKEGGK